MPRLLLLLALSCLAMPASANEQILSFDSHITVQSDGGMVVTELIRVRAEGAVIKRGIYRDFPTRYMDWRGRVVVPFQVVSVQKDGRDEPYHSESRANGERIYIGHSDTRLRPGVYEYEITYRTSRQLGFFAEHDELYWNVTGNDWAFPILQASATVRLPRAVPAGALRTEAYTGYTGDQGRAYRASVNEAGEAVYRTTTVLQPGQGFTIVAAWPKGLVTAPDLRQKLAYWSNDNPEWIAGAWSLALLLVYYLIVWSRYGRDPESGTIIPRFEPPPEVSAADARFLTAMGFDDRVSAAALISLAVKGYLRIVEDDGSYAVVSHSKTSRQPLTNDEQAFLQGLGLKESGGRLELEASNHHRFGNARSALRQELRKEHFKQNFVTNGKYTIPGLVISALALIYTSVSGPGGNPAAVFMLVWLTGWTFGVYFLLGAVIKLWREVVIARKYLMIIPALFMTAFATPFVAGEAFGIYMLTQAGSPLLAVLLFLLVGVNYAFYQWLKAPTRAGRRIYDALAGFRMYLAIAEKDRLNLLNAPQRTPELFEKYLPYALALGVENEWAEQFTGVLSATHAEGGAAYRPAWYGGTAWRAASYSAFAGSLAGAIASASSPPGSSSGSSGGGSSGGSSGGGGGGGGGGGW